MPSYGYPFRKSVRCFGTENPNNPMVYRVKSRPPVTGRIVKIVWSKKGTIWRDYRLPSFKNRGFILLPITAMMSRQANGKHARRDAGSRCGRLFGQSFGVDKKQLIALRTPGIFIS